MLRAGDVISHMEMCIEEDAYLQRGMNFRLGGDYSVILMSVRKGAPYRDQIQEEGRVLIYEGHDHPKRPDVPDTKLVDQPEFNPNGSYTQNGLFADAARRYKQGEPAELVRVYEKLQNGIWVHNGVFSLVDSWIERDGSRQVFKFKLVLQDTDVSETSKQVEIEHARFIPSDIKREVWKRDNGRCVKCGSTKNLHYDHIIPYSRGGTSLLASNIQLLCAAHNLAKHDKIE